MTTPLVVAVCVAGAVLLAVPPGPRWRRARERAAPGRGSGGWTHLVVVVACGGLGWVALGDTWGLVAAPVAAGVAHRVLAGAEPTESRLSRRRAARDLSAFVELLAATLRSGAGPAAGLATVCEALPGAVSDRLTAVRSGLALGTAPVQAWGALREDSVLAPLGRAMARAETSGVSVVATVERLADELEHLDLAAAEDRARAVGVRAAVPLGVCLLPAFLLLGIVPTVAGLLQSVLP